MSELCRGANVMCLISVVEKTSGCEEGVSLKTEEPKVGRRVGFLRQLQRDAIGGRKEQVRFWSGQQAMLQAR